MFAPPQSRPKQKANSKSERKQASHFNTDTVRHEPNGTTWTPEPMTRVSATDAPSEREASRVATQNDVLSSTPPPWSNGPGEDTSHDFAASLARERQNPGSPLPSTLGAAMGRRLGLNSSAVRLHQDNESNRLANEINAEAFTANNDIFLKRSFRPDTRVNQQLLTHELAHVAQRQRSPGPANEVFVQRAIAFDRGAAEATAKEVDKDKKVSDTMSVFWEFVTGMGQYFGMGYNHPADEPYRITGVFDTGDEAKLEQQIASRYATPISVQSARGGFQDVTAEDALGFWRTTRASLRKHATGMGEDDKKPKSSNDISIIDSHDPTLTSPMAEKKKTVHVSPERLKGMYFRTESQWGLFWVLLHEMMHVDGQKDAMTSSNMYGSPVTSDREISMHGDKEVRPVSVIGDVEFRLNVIRIGLGLPVRTNYSDDPPNAGATHGKPIGIYFADKPGPGQDEYVGAVITDPARSEAERERDAGSLFLSKYHDFKAVAAQRRAAKAAAKAAVLAPGLIVNELQFRNGGKMYTQSSPPITITISDKGAIEVSGGYEYVVNGERREGVVSNGGFTLEGTTDTVHIIFDWNESTESGWRRRGTADLTLDLVTDEYKRLEYHMAVRFNGNWTTDDDNASSTLSMVVTRILPSE